MLIKKKAKANEQHPYINIDFIITIVSIALNALCAQLKYVRLNGFDKDTLSND
jgi:hypothetical protein